MPFAFNPIGGIVEALNRVFESKLYRDLDREIFTPLAGIPAVGALGNLDEINNLRKLLFTQKLYSLTRRTPKALLEAPVQVSKIKDAILHQYNFNPRNSSSTLVFRSPQEITSNDILELVKDILPKNWSATPLKLKSQIPDPERQHFILDVFDELGRKSSINEKLAKKLGFTEEDMIRLYGPKNR